MKKRFSLASVFHIALLAAVYFFAAKFGLSISPVSGFATLVWAPTGIALAALLLWGNDVWPGIFIGAFLINFFTGAPVLAAFGIGVGNTLEAVLGAYLLRRMQFHNAFGNLNDILLLVFFGGMISTVISATIGVFTLRLAGIVLPGTISATWFAWWVGDMLGDILVASFLLSFFAGKRSVFTWKRRAGFVGLMALQIFVSIVVFWSFGANNVAYLVLLPLIWIALSFGPREIMAANFATASIAIWGTVRGLGPYATGGGLSDRLLFLQIFIGIVSLSEMILNAVVSERKRTETFLEQANDMLETEIANTKKFQEAVENVAAYVIITDLDGYILYANNAAGELTGYSPHELIGKKPSLYGRQMSREFYQNLWHTVKVEKKPFRSEVTNRKKNGKTYLVDSYITPILDKRGSIKYFVEVQRDITRERELERTKNDFIVLASHQLRTPLSGTKWIIETMQRGIVGPLTKNQKEYLNHMYQANERMIRLVGDLLNLLRFENEEPLVQKRWVGVADLFRDITTMVGPIAQKRKITVTSALKNLQTLSFEADADMLKNILYCFLANAVEYSAEGKTVALTVEKTNDAIVFSVRDSGIGIPKDEQKKIFERFFRAGNAKIMKPEGTGLGLALALLFAKKMGATITFTSEENKGSVFYLHLPAAYQAG